MVASIGDIFFRSKGMVEKLHQEEALQTFPTYFLIKLHYKYIVSLHYILQLQTTIGSPVRKDTYRKVITMAALKNSLSLLVLALTSTSFFPCFSARHLLQATPMAQPPPSTFPPLPKTTPPSLPSPPLPMPPALPQPNTQIPSFPNPTQTTIPNFPQVNFPNFPNIPFTLPTNFPFGFNIPNIPFLSPPPSK
ncbi:PREDICTED: RNA-binding protein 12 [Tarenaya hassleriana]|uniref:RNA-binding protein 12 n=1 Tax=Tarenaya hassleriana TaxID=28532 RepID=UPI00053C689D|nr:PREDICTED: RNA-binding protein 12 [Tarenaya hassleriana]